MEKISVYHSNDKKNLSDRKTEKCRHFEKSGDCWLADKCKFAHGNEELK